MDEVTGLSAKAKASSEEVVKFKSKLNFTLLKKEAVSSGITPLPSDQWVSLEDYQQFGLELEEFKKNMELNESAVKNVTGYLIFLRWETNDD